MRGPWKWIFAAVAFGGAFPLFCARHLPFSDLPEHVAVIATLRHWWDPAYRSQELFTIEGAFRTQYWLYDLVGALLAVPLGSAERANLVLLALAAVGTPYALRSLLRAAHQDERLAMLGAPLFWNRALAEGLVNFVASIPLCLLGLAWALEQAAEISDASSQNKRRTIALALISLALFYLHLSSFLLFVVCAVLFFVVLEVRARTKTEPIWRSFYRWIPRCAWLVPSLVAALVFVLTSTVTHPDASQGVHANVVRFFPKLMLLRVLPNWMHDIWISKGDDYAAMICWLGVLTTFLPRVASLPPEGDSARTKRWLVRSLVLIAAGFYFLFPSQVGFAFILDLRMAPFIGLFAVALARPQRGRRAALAASLIAVGAMISTVHCAIQMHAFERDEAAYVDLLLRRLPRGKRLLTLAFDARSPRTQIPPFLHVGAYYRARYGGIASFSFSELPHWPVRYRPEAAPPKKKIVFWDYAPCLFRNTTDGPAYDYILTRGERRPFDDDTPGPKWRILSAAREWRLYERVPGATVPIPEGFIDRGPCAVTQ